MTAATAVKARALPRTVAVIASAHDLRAALRLRRLPDFFEMRLDALAAIEDSLRKLRAPIIMTARHPLEGGIKNLSSEHRRDLLLRFLPQAACVDLELRSIQPLRVVWESARSQDVLRIASVHQFEVSATSRQLMAWLQAAQAREADILKVALRTDTAAEVDQLVSFVNENTGALPISAMGVGKFGRASRIQLARSGSALNYAHLGSAHAPGQLSLWEMRRLCPAR